MFLYQPENVGIVCEGCEIEISLNIYVSELTKSYLINIVTYAPILYGNNHGLWSQPCESNPVAM